MSNVIEFIYREMYSKIYYIQKYDTDSDQKYNYNDVEGFDENNEYEDICDICGEGDKCNNGDDLNDDEEDTSTKTIQKYTLPTKLPKYTLPTKSRSKKT